MNNDTENFSNILFVFSGKRTNQASSTPTELFVPFLLKHQCSLYTLDLSSFKNT